MRRFQCALFVAVAAVSFASVASAADMSVKAPVYKATPIDFYDWTGLYVGAYAGVGVQRSHGGNPQGFGEFDYTGSGFAAGGTLGYNWQFNRNWVLGVEGDVGYLSLDRLYTEYEDFGINSKTTWMGTLRGRAGYTNGPTLSYVTGGAAFVHIEDVSDLSIFRGPITTNSATKTGYVLGSGVETMLGGNWTAKAEYLFVNVGSGDTVDANNANVRTDQHRYHLMKYGINYLFGGKLQPALQPHNWNGFNVGAIGGIGVTSSRGTDPTGRLFGEIDNNGTGITIGGQAGYNWQFAPSWVAGIEGDISWLGIDHGNIDLYDIPATLGIKTNWLATLRGRVGYSTGPALLYVTGGGAWVNVRDSFQGSAAWAGGPLVSSTKTLSGYTVGGGIETVLTGKWTSRSEYLYVNAGDGDTLNSAGDLLRASHQFHLFRTGLSYSFGG